MERRNLTIAILKLFQKIASDSPYTLSTNYMYGYKKKALEFEFLSSLLKESMK